MKAVTISVVESGCGWVSSVSEGFCEGEAGIGVLEADKVGLVVGEGS